MAKREFCMLSHTFKPERHSLVNTSMSEKLDGQRAIWLPWTRGIPKSQVPFANCDKDDRLLEDQVSTGLWSRLGNVVQAPEYWLDQLPPVNLDGELYSTSLIRQALMSIVKKLPKNRVDKDWDEVHLHAFDSPQHSVLMADGIINTVNFKKTLKDAYKWAILRGAKKYDLPSPSFLSVQKNLQKILHNYDRVKLVAQTRLATDEQSARDVAFRTLAEITDRGGEGLMCRSVYSNYQCQRSHSLLKLKKLDDDDGEVVGYITGRKTDKGSKLLGKMGALILKLDNGRKLELSGFTDEERKLQGETYNGATQWAMEHPETLCPDWIEAPHFPRGTRVTFAYRGLSRDGIPNEARYYRKRLDE